MLKLNYQKAVKNVRKASLRNQRLGIRIPYGAPLKKPPEWVAFLVVHLQKSSSVGGSAAPLELSPTGEALPRLTTEGWETAVFLTGHHKYPRPKFWVGGICLAQQLQEFERRAITCCHKHFIKRQLCDKSWHKSYPSGLWINF